MKLRKLFVFLLALLVVLGLSGCGGGGGSYDDPTDNNGGGDPPAAGTVGNPYTVAQALNVVKDFTWTSNTEYDSTDDVYMKGKISRIASNGTFTEGGTYGNASFFISDDGTETDEFFCFRVLYLGNKKFEAGQTDIKVGDKVVICGKLMKYKGNTPETVSGKAYLYSLNDTGNIEPMTISAYLTEPVSTTQWYELTGTVSNIVNTTYGHFDLTDASGKVYVFGLCATKVEKNDKSFASLDIKEGDNITIITLRSEFNGNPQAGGNTPAYLKSKNGALAAGTAGNPYTVAQALDVVKDFTWTSNTEYDSTDDVYMKGKISRIASLNGTFTESGTYGNASFFISDNGTETNEFYCFRILYLGNKEFETGQIDIRVGDEVVICGKLMNYKENTPETVSGKAYLYSLESNSLVSFATNSKFQAWASATDGTYGSGYQTTVQQLKIGFYKHTGSTSLVAPNANYVRIYKNNVFRIESDSGKKIKKIVIGCVPDSGTDSYCFDMAGLEGSATAICDKSALTVTWTGSASKVVLQANNGQIRMEKLTVEFE